MEEHELCFICFHHIKESGGGIVSKNLLKVYEQLSDIKLEKQPTICSLCNTRLCHALQLFLLAMRIEDLDTSASSDKIAEKIKFISLQQCDVLNYSIPKYVIGIKEETEDSEDIILSEAETYFDQKINKELSMTDPLTTNSLEVPLSESNSMIKPDPLIIKKSNFVYICEYCNKKYISYAYFTRHLRDAHRQIRKFICNYCEKVFYLKARLVNHMRVHTGEKPFQCGECGHRVATSTSLYQHRSVTHRRRRPHVCPTCNKGFPYRSALEVHLRWHTGERPFPCECGHRFHTRSALVKHRKVIHGGHSSNAKHICACGLVLSSKGELVSHQTRLKCNPTKWKFRKVCVCGNSYRTQEALAWHRKHKGCPAPRPTVRPSPLDVYRCHCGQEFKAKWLLNSHMKVHLMFELGSFACPVCTTAKFTSAYTLSVHMKMHPHADQCDSCQVTLDGIHGAATHIRQYHYDLYV